MSQQRITDIENDRFGVPRRPTLTQLARALKLDIDVLYFWGRRNSAGHSRGRAFGGDHPEGVGGFSRWCGGEEINAQQRLTR